MLPLSWNLINITLQKQHTADRVHPLTSVTCTLTLITRRLTNSVSLIIHSSVNKNIFYIFQLRVNLTFTFMCFILITLKHKLMAVTNFIFLVMFVDNLWNKIINIKYETRIMTIPVQTRGSEQINGIIILSSTLQVGK